MTAARESVQGVTPVSALDWLIDDCVADLTFPAAPSCKQSSPHTACCSPAPNMPPLSASSADDGSQGFKRLEHSQSRSPGGSLEFTSVPSAIMGRVRGISCSVAQQSPSSMQAERTQAPSPDSVTTVQHFSSQPCDSLMSDPDEEALQPDCSYGQQSMRSLQSEAPAVALQLQGVSDKNVKRICRRMTNRESAMRMRRKRAQSHQAIMADLQAMQGENLRLKQVQVGSTELLHNMKREIAQWQARAQNAQNQNAMLVQQILEQHEVPYQPAHPLRRRLLHQPRAEASLLASAAMSAQTRHQPAHSQPAPKAVTARPLVAASRISAPAADRLGPAREAVLTSIFEGRPLDVSPSSPDFMTADDSLRELLDQDADFMSMMQLLAGSD